MSFVYGRILTVIIVCSRYCAQYPQLIMCLGYCAQRLLQVFAEGNEVTKIGTHHNLPVLSVTDKTDNEQYYSVVHARQ